MKPAAFLLLLILFSSCTFDKIIVQATKIPADKKEGRVIKTLTRDGKVTGRDTTVLHIGANYQPVFTDTRNEPKALPYTVESVVFNNATGTALNGWMIKPKAVTPKITLLYLHGNGGNVIEHYPGMLTLVERGFQVFMADYSGFGFSGGKATRKHVLNDAIAALKYVHDRDDVKNTSLIVYGQSMGGHFAPGVVAAHAAMTDGMVIEGGFPSYKRLAAHLISVGIAARVLVKNDYNVAKALRDYHKPVLVIHSREDEVVPLAMGRQLFEAAGEPKSFYEIDKCHVYGPGYYPDSISARIRTMVKK